MTVVALVTPEHVAAEGAEQLNCVATYAAWIESGCGYVYRVLRPERATVAIQQRTGWKLGDSTN